MISCPLEAMIEMLSSDLSLLKKVHGYGTGNRWGFKLFSHAALGFHGEGKPYASHDTLKEPGPTLLFCTSLA